MSTPWTMPSPWPVPVEWAGERCFVLCTGESLKAQRRLIPQLKGRVIAVKHAVRERPNADVLFLSGEGTADVARELVPLFHGTHVIVRGRSDPSLPAHVKRVTRTKDHTRWSTLPDHVAGRDSGTSAINIATLFGATEIVLLGFDMTGGHYCRHPLPFPPLDHFVRHMEVLPLLAEDAKARGIRIVNVSPISKVDCFERGRLEDFL